MYPLRCILIRLQFTFERRREYLHLKRFFANFDLYAYFYKKKQRFTFGMNEVWRE